MESINARLGFAARRMICWRLIRRGIDDLGDLPPDMENVPVAEITPVLPYDTPPKIWLIGLNYRSHAEDINAVQPEEPGSFMKPASCMFEPEGTIQLPPPEVSNDVEPKANWP